MSVEVENSSAMSASILIGPDAFKLYELGVNRIMKEGDWIWLRLKLFLGINVGVFALGGLVTHPYLDKSIADISSLAMAAIFFLSVVGFICALSWRQASKQSTEWQRFFSEIAKNIEKRIIQNDQCSMYINIRLLDKKEAHRLSDKALFPAPYYSHFDVANISTVLATLLGVMWVIIFSIVTAYKIGVFE